MAADVLRLYLGNVAGPLGPKTPIYAFAVKQSEGVTLIDTGMDDPGDAEWTKTYPVEWRPIAYALGDHGLTLEDVTTIVITHLDHDHAGNNNLFPHATVVVQRAEIEHARAEQPDSIRQLWDYPGAKFRIIDGDEEISPDVTAISTPGHTPGHQSVLVGRGEEAQLIVGDAAYTFDIWHLLDKFDESHAAWGLQIRTNKETWLRSVRKLRGITARALYFCHDNRIAPTKE